MSKKDKIELSWAGKIIILVIAVLVTIGSLYVLLNMFKILADLFSISL